MASVDTPTFRSRGPSKSAVTPCTMSWSDATPMTLAKIMTPTGSKRAFPTGKAYEDRCDCRRVEYHTIMPERRSRKESMVDAMTATDRDDVAATIFMAARAMLHTSDIRIANVIAAAVAEDDASREVLLAPPPHRPPRGLAPA